MVMLDKQWLLNCVGHLVAGGELFKVSCGPCKATT